VSTTPDRGLPIGGISNGDDQELGHLTPGGEVQFAQDDGYLVGPAAIDPQDAHRLMQELAPIMSITHGDIVDGEFDKYLEGYDGLAVYHQMLTDGTVENAFNYLLGSMLAVDWKIDPASLDEADIEIAAWIADQLGLDDTGVGSNVFSRLLTVFMNSLAYGKAYGEIVMAPGTNNRVILEKIVSIHPFSVAEVKHDERGQAKQLVLNGFVRGTAKPVADKKVPLWKTVTFTHKDDGTGEGRSFLRAAVAHWRVKRSLIVMINQSVERFLIGVPMVKVPRTVKINSVGWQQARKLITDFVIRPRTGLVLPPDWEFEVVKFTTQMPDAKPYLEYHDSAIARALGIDWNTIAGGAEGMKYTAASTLEGITRNTVRRLLGEFISVLNTQLIPKLVLLNWPTVKRYPRIVYDMESREDFSASANLMGMLINAAKDSLNANATGTGPDGEATSTGYNPEQLGETITALMRALPPRFKRALGFDEVELNERMRPYRSSVHSLYTVDNRKLQPPVPKVRDEPEGFGR
jgi:hypothetical protein